MYLLKLYVNTSLAWSKIDTRLSFIPKVKIHNKFKTPIQNSQFKHKILIQIRNSSSKLKIQIRNSNSKSKFEFGVKFKIRYEVEIHNKFKIQTRNSYSKFEKFKFEYEI